MSNSIKRPGRPTKDMPGIYEWPLAADLYDLRDIPPEEVGVATNYEYAASCEWIRLLWQSWVSTPFPVWQNVQLARDLWTVQWDARKTSPVSVVLTKICRDGIPRLSSKKYTTVIERLVSTIPHQLRCPEFDDIVFAVPSFPTPWLQLDKESKSRLKEWFDWPRRQDPAFSVFEPGEPVALYRQDPSYKDSIFEVALDWGRREEDIAKDFQAWLSPKYKLLGHGPAAKAKTGMASSDGYQRLRWLTAWRLHRSGLKHEAAQKVMEARNKSQPSKNDHDFPLTPDEATWRNYHSKARNECRKRFPYPVA